MQSEHIHEDGPLSFGKTQLDETRSISFTAHLNLQNYGTYRRSAYWPPEWSFVSCDTDSYFQQNSINQGRIVKFDNHFLTYQWLESFGENLRGRVAFKFFNLKSSTSSL